MGYSQQIMSFEQKIDTCAVLIFVFLTEKLYQTQSVGKKRKSKLRMNCQTSQNFLYQKNFHTTEPPKNKKFS